MNSLFVSPHFPPHYYLFCSALRESGVTVLGLGDAPYASLSAEVRASLDDYVAVPRLDDDDAVLRAAASLIARHGRIDHLDSLNEHWLELEARLRLDFNVPGPKPDAVLRVRSKMEMARAFEAKGLEAPACVWAKDTASVRALAQAHGLPLVVKPDRGVGAEEAFVAATQEDLASLLSAPPPGAVVQPFVCGRLTSFDGLVDADGRVAFSSSFVYCEGVLEIVRDQRDVFYYTRRNLPAELEAVGRAMVGAFDLRARFFHAELFETEDGRFVPLELNARPPGGFSTHLMNYSADVDVARLWAGVVTHADLGEPSVERKYHAAHVSRRPGRAYALSHEEALELLRPWLLFWAELPPVIAHAMGTPVYVLRHEDEASLLQLIHRVHARAG
jgi:hypothetical protein